MHCFMIMIVRWPEEILSPELLISQWLFKRDKLPLRLNLYYTLDKLKSIRKVKLGALLNIYKELILWAKNWKDKDIHGQ